MTPSTKPWHIAALVLTASFALTACGKKEDGTAAGKAQAGQQAPAPEVRVVTVQPQDVILENNLPARLESVRSATIVPQVSGIVKRRLFEEGAFVRAGQPLYQLEDASYSATLANAHASLLSSQAALSKASADLARYQPLLAADAISKQEYDAALAAQRAAQAQVKAAQAMIRAAQVNVNHARIVAPISGVIGESKISEGSFVAAGQTQMALIQQNDPMYVNITQSANEMMKLRRQLANNERKPNQNIEVGIVLEDGSEYEHKGRLLFVNSAVDAQTGQIGLRVAVPNPDWVLMSGLYVRVKLPFSTISNAFVVPQQAVTRGSADTVLVVAADGSMQPRPVTIVGQNGSDWVITKGLNAGDKVIVEGTMIAGIMGAKKVTPKEWEGTKATVSVPPAKIQAASQVAPASAPIQAASATASAAQ